MPATKIMVIRHAEKPNGAAGVLPDGTSEPEALTVAGWQRAGALVGLFAPLAGHFGDPHLAIPQTIFASAVAHHSKSMRPQQTVSPLAAKLALPIRTDFTKGDETALAQAAMATDGVVLVCWQHELIPHIAQAVLGASQGVPQHWPDHRFDLVWVFDPAGATWHFTQVPQRLLAGELIDPIPLG